MNRKFQKKKSEDQSTAVKSKEGERKQETKNEDTTDPLHDVINLITDYTGQTSSMMQDKNLSDEYEYTYEYDTSTVGKPKCTCGTKKESGARIVGGKDADINKHPWKVQ